MLATTATTTTEGHHMLTLNQVCDRLAISRHSAINAINAGELHAIKVNGRYRIEEAWVEDYIARADATAD